MLRPISIKKKLKHFRQRLNSRMKSGSVNCAITNTKQPKEIPSQELPREPHFLTYRMTGSARFAVPINRCSRKSNSLILISLLPYFLSLIVNLQLKNSSNTQRKVMRIKIGDCILMWPVVPISCQVNVIRHPDILQNTALAGKTEGFFMNFKSITSQVAREFLKPKRGTIL